MAATSRARLVARALAETRVRARVRVVVLQAGVVCPPGDPVAFGRAIVDLLADPARAALIGRRGRLVAEQRFHYALYGDTLARAFAETVGVIAS
jgi:starch synthase